MATKSHKNKKIIFNKCYVAAYIANEIYKYCNLTSIWDFELLRMKIGHKEGKHTLTNRILEKMVIKCYSCTEYKGTKVQCNQHEAPKI